jgi:hypothetical protein
MRLEDSEGNDNGQAWRHRRIPTYIAALNRWHLFIVPGLPTNMSGRPFEGFDLILASGDVYFPSMHLEEKSLDQHCSELSR